MTRSGSTKVFFDRYIVLSTPSHKWSGIARTRPKFRVDLINSWTCVLACIGTISPSMSSKFSSSEIMPASCMRRTSFTVKERRSKPSAARVTLALIVSAYPAPSQRAPDLLDIVAFDNVADAHVLVVLKRHAAFLSGLHLGDFVLEALQRRQFAFMHDDIVADQAHMRAALDIAVGDPAARDVADLRNIEDFEDRRIAEHFLAQGRRKHARHRRFHIVDEVVDDVVVANLDALAFGEVARFLMRAHVEADDDRLRRLREGHVGFGDAADARMDDARPDLVGAQLVEGGDNRL